MKLVVLFSSLIGGSYAKVVSSDRFLIKILDRSISLQDITYQARNLKALNCVYEDSIVIQYFKKSFITDLSKFIKNFPQDKTLVRDYLHANEELLKQTRNLFKMLRYSEDQKTDVSQKLTQLIREGAKANKCESAVLYKDSLKTNFINLIELEMYLKSRYSSQVKQGFDVTRSSIDLFTDSLDKQFGHEYYW